MLDRRRWVSAALFAVIGAVLLLIFHVERFGERTLDVSINREEAIELAQAFCREHGPELDGYRLAASFESSLNDAGYVHLVRSIGAVQAEQLAVEETVPWAWRVRWFKPLESEEFNVGVDGMGRIVWFDHWLPENQAGASVETETARALAEQFVGSRFGRPVTDTNRYKLLYANSEKKEKRVDHEFAWERIDRKVEDGEFRTVARVQGDRVGAIHSYYKAPEEFLRQFHEDGMPEAISGLIMVLFGLASLVLVGIYLFRAFRAGILEWDLPIRIGLLGAGLFAAATLNEIPSFFRSYDTSQALGAFLGIEVIGRMVAAVFIGLGVTVIVALALALFRALFPQEMSPGRWFGLLRLREGGVRFWSDVLLLAAAMELAGKGVETLKRWGEFRWFTKYLKPDDFSPAGLNTALPALDGLFDGLKIVVVLFSVLGLVFIWKQAVMRTWVLLMGVGVIVLLMDTVGEAEDFRHFVFLSTFSLLSIATLLFLIVRVVRFNLLAYAVSAWMSELISSGWSLARTTEPSFQANGLALLLLGFLPLLLPLAAWLRGKLAPPPVANPPTQTPTPALRPYG